jgi:acyl dehydratase
MQAAQLRHHQEQGQHPRALGALQVLPLVPPAHQAPRDSLAIFQLEGREYGPFPLRVCREKVDEFVDVTGDERSRWTSHAPPGWAAALLFVAAPHFLSDPALSDITRSVIHGEQKFRWAAPIPIEEELSVRGTVTKARERGGVWFVTFDLDAGPVRGTSIFLMSSARPPAGATEESTELNPAEKDPGEFSASRADLIRYAAATRDWNSIHWDHKAAVEAGLGGIVVHGLLQAAWVLRRFERVAEARFRFRAPLPVGKAAQFEQKAEDSQVTARLSRDGQELVLANLLLA